MRFITPNISKSFMTELGPDWRQYHEECRSKTSEEGIENAAIISVLMPEYHRLHDKDYGIDLRYWGCTAIVSTSTSDDKVLVIRSAARCRPNDTNDSVGEEFKLFLTTFIEEALGDTVVNDE